MLGTQCKVLSVGSYANPTFVLDPYFHPFTSPSNIPDKTEHPPEMEHQGGAVFPRIEEENIPHQQLGHARPKGEVVLITDDGVGWVSHSSKICCMRTQCPRSAQIFPSAHTLTYSPEASSCLHAARVVIPLLPTSMSKSMERTEFHANSMGGIVSFGPTCSAG